MSHLISNLINKFFSKQDEFGKERDLGIGRGGGGGACEGRRSADGVHGGVDEPEPVPELRDRELVQSINVVLL